MITLNLPDAPTSTDVEDQPATACSVCAHPLATHDRIAARYCEATQSSAIARGCICRAVG
jgi:hypothetical protein